MAPRTGVIRREAFRCAGREFWRRPRRRSCCPLLEDGRGGVRTALCSTIAEPGIRNYVVVRRRRRPRLRHRRRATSSSGAFRRGPCRPARSRTNVKGVAASAKTGQHLRHHDQTAGGVRPGDATRWSGSVAPEGGCDRPCHLTRTGRSLYVAVARGTALERRWTRRDGAIDQEDRDRTPARTTRSTRCDGAEVYLAGLRIARCSIAGPEDPHRRARPSVRSAAAIRPVHRERRADAVPTST